ILVAGCARKQEVTPGRLTVLRFENLSGNSSFDWMERGAARQIASQVKGATAVDSHQRQTERERAIVTGATGILHGYVSQSGGRLRLRAELEDAGPGKCAGSAEAAGPVSAGLVPLANAVARQLDPGASAAGAKSEAALAAFIGALEASDSGAAAGSLSRAIAADPDFGAAYLTLIELSLARKDRATAERIVAMARARGGALSPIDRARLDVASAQMSGDAAALSQSLAMLSRLTPADQNLLRALADSELASRRYPAAID